MVCDKDFELRSPLDFYTTRNDVHLLPWTRVDVPGTDVGPLTGLTNWALDTNGSVATASTTNGSFPTAYAIDNELGGAAHYWNDNTNGVFPDWLQIDFGQDRRICNIVYYGRQQNLTKTTPPNDGDISDRALSDFTIEYWTTDKGWQSLVVKHGNNLVKAGFQFAPVTTSKILLTINATVPSGYSRVVELQAWG